MSRPPFGPRLQPHVHARFSVTSRVRWRRELSLRHAPTRVALMLVAAVLPRTTPLAAQQPQLAPYKPPVIALVQPSSGGSVPQDRPVVVFRLTQGEPADPIDLRSLTVIVDRDDRTRLFQLAVLTPAAGAAVSTTAEAWGPLAPTGGDTVAIGPHQVRARICSSRGACAEVSTTVLIAPTPTPTAPANAGEPQTLKRRVLDALLGATKKIFIP